MLTSGRAQQQQGVRACMPPPPAPVQVHDAFYLLLHAFRPYRGTRSYVRTSLVATSSTTLTSHKQPVTHAYRQQEQTCSQTAT